MLLQQFLKNFTYICVEDKVLKKPVYKITIDENLNLYQYALLKQKFDINVCINTANEIQYSIHDIEETIYNIRPPFIINVSEYGKLLNVIQE